MRPRLQGLTGLRAMAGWAVVVLHVGYLLPATGFTSWAWTGREAVSLFFVLSGFVLTWSAPENDSPACFWWRRGSRVLPLHALVWVVTAGLLLALGQHVSPAAFVSGLLLVHVWLPDVAWTYRVNQPAWSLGVEAFFYAVFPFLYLRVRAATVARLVAGAVLCQGALAALVVSAAVLLAGGRQEWVLWVSPPVRLLEFATGVLLASAVKGGWRPRVRLWPLLLVLVLVTAGGSLLGTSEAWTLSGAAHVLLAPCAALTVLGVALRDLHGGSRWSWPWVVRLGDWSYATYVVHWPVLLLWQDRGWDHPVGVVTALLVVLALSALLHSLVERPAEKALRRHGPSRRRSPTVPTPGGTAADEALRAV